MKLITYVLMIADFLMGIANGMVHQYWTAFFCILCGIYLAIYIDAKGWW